MTYRKSESTRIKNASVANFVPVEGTHLNCGQHNLTYVGIEFGGIGTFVENRRNAAILVSRVPINKVSDTEFRVVYREADSREVLLPGDKLFEEYSALIGGTRQ